LKSQYTKEIEQLRRQLTHRAPFDELHAKKNISTLKNQLKSAKSELSKTHAWKEKQRGAPGGVDLIDNTLKVVTAMQKQRKEIENENAMLKEKLNKLEAVAQDEDYEKSKYMEGAVWMGRRMSSEVEKFCQTLDELQGEFNERLSDFGMVNGEHVQRNKHWFVEALRQSSYQLYERLVTMIESAIHHLEEAQRKVREAKGEEGGASEEGDIESLFKATATFNER